MKDPPYPPFPKQSSAVKLSLNEHVAAKCGNYLCAATVL